MLQYTAPDRSHLHLHRRTSKKRKSRLPAARRNALFEAVSEINVSEEGRSKRSRPPDQATLLHLQGEVGLEDRCLFVWFGRDLGTSCGNCLGWATDARKRLGSCLRRVRSTGHLTPLSCTVSLYRQSVVCRDYGTEVCGSSEIRKTYCQHLLNRRLPS